MKKKIAAALAAFSLALSLAGCTMTTPSTVGTIGEVEFPAGLYLLIQHNAYQQADGLTTDENVLKATLTLEDGTEKKGADYVAEETMKQMESYAAVETRFAELGGELGEAELAFVDSQTDGMWTNYKETLEANGIGKEAVKLYMANAAKASMLLDMIYGKEGTDPIADDEMWAYVDENFRLGQYIVLPLMDTAAYTPLDEEGKAAMQAVADKMKADLDAGKTVGDVARTYLPEALPLIGDEYREEDLPMYMSQMMYSPSVKDNFSEAVSEAVVNTQAGDSVVVDDGGMLFVYKADELRSVYPELDALRGTAIIEMKADELNAAHAEAGAALAHNLDAKAMKTYSAKNIQ